MLGLIFLILLFNCLIHLWIFGNFGNKGLKSFLKSLFFYFVENLWLEKTRLWFCQLNFNFLKFLLFSLQELLLLILDQIYIIIPQKNILLLVQPSLSYLRVIHVHLTFFYHLLFAFSLSEHLNDLLLRQVCHVTRKFKNVSGLIGLFRLLHLHPAC